MCRRRGILRQNQLESERFFHAVRTFSLALCGRGAAPGFFRNPGSFCQGNALAGLILFLHLMRDRIYLMGVMTEIGIFRQVHIMSDIAQVTVEALLNTGCGN